MKNTPGNFVDPCAFCGSDMCKKFDYKAFKENIGKVFGLCCSAECYESLRKLHAANRAEGELDDFVGKVMKLFKGYRYTRHQKELLTLFYKDTFALRTMGQ